VRNGATAQVDAGGGGPTRSKQDSRPVPILMYHHVGPVPPAGLERYSVTPSRFARQMQLLSLLGYRVISMSELFQRWALKNSTADSGDKAAVLTFDDGYADCVEHAIPILDERGWKATFFLVSGDMGGPGRWLGPEWSSLLLMDWSSARSLVAAGHAAGSHTVTHRSLLGLSPDAVQDELLRSKADIEDELGVAVHDLSYPFGITTDSIMESAQAAGYRSAVSTAVALADQKMDRYFLPRVAVQGVDSLWDFAFRLRWANRPVDQLLVSPTRKLVASARRVRSRYLGSGRQ
jgi:peptidoglycan/xylan/chitin deacetylase (PgdA/CDA1 family)